jgi:predicted dehydrogenase
VAADTVGIGVLGCGGVASFFHLPTLVGHPRARVVAVADPAPPARERASAIAPAAIIEADPRAVLDRAEVDAVVVCADNAHHADLACQAAQAGKDLYLEKPLALRLEDGRAAVEAVRTAGVRGTIGFSLRFHPLHQRAQTLLGDGRVGKVRAVRAALHEPARRRRMPAWKRRRATGGGALLDLGSHAIDLLRWHLRDEVARASATLGSRRTEHDSVRLHVTMASGVKAEVDCRIGVARAGIFEIEGTEGTLRADRYGGRLSVGHSPRNLVPVGTRARAALTRPPREPSFELALGAWLDQLCGAETELPTLEDGLKSLEVVLAAEQSAG